MPHCRHTKTLDFSHGEQQWCRQCGCIRTMRPTLTPGVWEPLSDWYVPGREWDKTQKIRRPVCSGASSAGR